MRTRTFLAGGAGATAILAAALLVGTAGLAGAEEGESFTVHQAAPALRPLDHGPLGRSHGDVLTFSAPVRTDDGRIGVLHGLLVTVEVRGDGQADESRVGQIILDFGNGDSIAIAGASVYGADEVEMEVGRPQVRAVIGGTGVHIGARGEVTTTRNADGSYTHAVTLLP